MPCPLTPSHSLPLPERLAPRSGSATRTCAGTAGCRTLPARAPSAARGREVRAHPDRRQSVPGPHGHAAGGGPGRPSDRGCVGSASAVGVGRRGGPVPGHPPDNRPAAFGGPNMVRGSRRASGWPPSIWIAARCCSPRPELKRRRTSTSSRAKPGCGALDPGGLEPLAATLDAFAAALPREAHLKRALTDPHIFSGIGNAYSDEILHAARLSPVR